MVANPGVQPGSPDPSGSDFPPNPSKGQLRTEAWRFVIVGIINTVVDLGVLNLLIQLTHTGEKGLHFMLIKTTSFMVAVMNSYYLNRVWTFRATGRQKSLVRSGSQFLIVSLIGAVVNVGTASYVATFVPPAVGLEKLWPSAAALVGTACSFVWNFIGYKYIVFSSRNQAAY
ncbi:MAG TPA: GtrA family protein [Terriglobales bacterium]|nr:GtrA family protein [Terriglobales bacterium]